MPDMKSQRPIGRDLADARHAHRSLLGSVERRLRALRRRRLERGGRSAAVAVAAILTLGAAGAVAHESAGAPDRATTARASSAGFDVAAVQRKLGVAADGVAGPQTRRAIRRFQRRNGLAVDGVVGPRTLAALGLAAPQLTRTPPATTSKARPRAAAPVSARLQRIAACESGGDPTAVSADGRYRGKYQFSRATWRSRGGTGDPAKAPEAVQDRLAAQLMARQGPSAWPSCAR